MNKKLKKTISLILCMIMLFGAAPLSGIAELDFSKLNIFSGLHLPKLSLPEFDLPFGMKASAEETASGTCGDNVTWSYNTANQTLTISGEGEMYNYLRGHQRPWLSFNNSIVTVDVQNGVTDIGNYAFYNCSGLTNVTLPDSLTSIGERVFYRCSGLTNVTLPDSVTSIGNGAFSGCTGLTNITIPDSVTSIGAYAFDSVRNISYSLSMTATGSPWGARNVIETAFIEDHITYNDESKTKLIQCSSLASGSITIPDSVTSIGDSAFYNCTGLTSITIPDSVTSIGNRAFDGCTGLTSITIPDSVTSIGNRAFYNCTGLTSITIPEGVTSIGSSTFYGCTGLTSITIPNSVTSIYNCAFYGCTGLTSITIPEGVTSIGNRAFYGCAGLETINYNAINCSSVCQGVMNNFHWLSNCTGLRTVNIGDSVEYLPRFFLFECENIAEIHIPDSVTNMGTSVFSCCSGLTSINIPNGVTNLGLQTFFNCTSLASISIPDSVTSIGNRVFMGCSGLANVTIPDSVTSIGAGAFSRVCNLSYSDTMTVSGSPWGALSVNGYVDGYLVYNNESKTELRACSSLASGSITIPDSVTSIGDRVFMDCSVLTSITIPEGVTSIGNSAFYGCTGLTSITIPDGVASIGNSAFRKCTGLTSITIPNSVTSIGNGTFDGCTGLKSITIPNGVTSIGNFTFDGCTGLKSITLSDSLTNIGEYAFYNCTGLTSITIPNGVTNIGNSAFSNCTGLTSITLSDSLTNIGEWAFCNCTGLTSITIPNSVTSIGKNAFYLVNNIRCSDKMTAAGSPWGAKAVEAYIENGLIYYDDTKVVLTGCLPSAADSSGNVVIPDTVAEVGDYAFTGCNNAVSVTFGSAEIIDFSSTCFAGCDNLETVSSPNTDSDGITYMLDEPYAYHSAVKTGGARRAPAKAASSAGSGVDFNEFNGILFCNRSKSGEYSVPARIRYICENAFMNCVNLTVNLDNCDLRKIGRNAFMNSGNYNSWDKSGLFTIGNNIIGAANALSSLNVASSYRCIADCAFEICENLGSITISSSSLFIGRDAFKNTAYVRNPSKWNGGALYIGNQLVEVSEDYSGPFTVNPGTVSIAAGAFSYCTGVTAVTLPDSIRDIGESAFEYCFNLESVMLGGVETIGYYAFRDCSSLTDITIPAGVEKISEYAFMNCTSLEGFNVAADNENYSSADGVLFSKNGASLIQYPAGRADIGIYDINAIDGCNRIESLAFGSCKNIGEIKMPPDNSKTVYFGYRNPFFRSSAKVNGSYLVIRGDKLVRWADDSPGAAFTVPDGIVKIGANAFAYCTNLKSITFNEGLTEIMNGAFFGCTGLESIVLPASVGKIERSAFENCENLKSVTFTNNNVDINDGLTSVGTCAFAGCADGIEFINREFLIKLGDVGPCAFGHEEEVKKEISPKSREATCTEDGFEYARVYCNACGKEHTDLDAEKILKATGHNFSAFTRNSSDTEKGVCSKCGETVLRPYNAGREADSPGVIEGRRKLESFFYSFIRRLLEFLTFGLIKIN